MRLDRAAKPGDLPGMSFRILVTAPTLEASGRDLLDAAGCEVHLIARAADRADTEAKLAAIPFDAVISRAVPISAAAMASCPSLRVISRAAVGTDIIDIPAATARGITVLAAAGSNARSVAEYTIGLMLAVARHIPAHHARTRAGQWERLPLGLEMHGRTLGLVGYGRIAQNVARIADAMGMRVLAWSPNLAARGAEPPASAVPDLHALVAASDVISLHAPLTETSRGMIGAAEIALFRPETILLNTGRGGLIDEAALATALHEGRLHGAGLDVLSVEPSRPDNPLLAAPRTVLSPHVAAATTVARSATARIAVEQALAALRGEVLPPGAWVNEAGIAAAAPRP